MKKKLFLLPFALFSFVLGGSLVACNKTSNGSAKSSQQQKITISAEKTKITYPETLQLTASVDGVAWSVDKADVASITQAGLLTPLKDGTVSVKANKDGYKEGSLSITINYEKINVTAAENKTSLIIGETVALTANQQGVTWSSSDENVASVSNTGLVTAKAKGSATIKASKERFADGTVTITVTRPGPTATLHFEDADHYAADGWWQLDKGGSMRGPGATPIYQKENIGFSDDTCVAYMEAGDKETLTFTSSKATKAELVITMGNATAFEKLADVETIKFNNANVSLGDQGYDPQGSGGTYVVGEATLGELDIKSGDNVLVVEFLAEAPYLDDLMIYAKDATTQIQVKKAADKSPVDVDDTLQVNVGKTVQIPARTQGVNYRSLNENIVTVNNGSATGVAEGKATILAYKEGMLSKQIEVTVTQEGKIQIEAEANKEEAEALGIVFRTPSAYSNASGDVITTIPEGVTLTLTFNATTSGKMNLIMHARGNQGEGYSYNDVDLSTNVELKFNNVAVNMTGTVTGSTLTDYTLGEVNVINGTNTIALKCITIAPTIDYFALIPIA